MTNNRHDTGGTDFEAVRPQGRPISTTGRVDQTALKALINKVSEPVVADDCSRAGIAPTCKCGAEMVFNAGDYVCMVCGSSVGCIS